MRHVFKKEEINHYLTSGFYDDEWFYVYDAKEKKLMATYWDGEKTLYKQDDGSLVMVYDKQVNNIPEKDVPKALQLIVLYDGSYDYFNVEWYSFLHRRN